MNLRVLVRTAMLGAMAALLMHYVKTALPLFPQFIKYDPGDIPVLVGGLAMGPVVGLVVEALKLVLDMFVSGQSNPIGYVANGLHGTGLLLTLVLVYKASTSPRRAVWGAVLAPLVAAAIMIPANMWVFLPAHGIVGDQARAMAVVTLTPFNIVKGLISATVAVAIHRRLAGAMALAERAGVGTTTD